MLESNPVRTTDSKLQEITTLIRSTKLLYIDLQRDVQRGNAMTFNLRETTLETTESRDTKIYILG